MNPAPPDLRTSDEVPGVPGFRSWRGLYIFVLIWFLMVVGLLLLFSRYFA